MCRKLALTATILTLCAGAAGAATTPAATPAPQMTAVTPAAPPTAPAPPPRATAQQRAEIERLDPLARAAFWAHEADLDPRDAEAGVKLAKALRQMGRFDEAAAAAEQVLLIDPANLDGLLEEARAKIGAGQGFYAIDSAQRASTVAPRDWRPVDLLAIALEQADRPDEALAAHQRALSLAPNNPAVLTNLGMFYASHDEPAKAEDLLRRAAAAPGAGIQQRQNLALILGLEGNAAEAEHLARQDLPPEMVSNNLAYFKAAAAPPTGRSWQSMNAAQ